MSVGKGASMCAVVVLVAVALCAPPTPSSDGTEPTVQPVIVLAPCALPNPDIASSLPWFIKPGDVICLSVTADDVNAEEQARLLLVEAGARMQSENSYSHVAVEYNHGVADYAKGRYSEAIAHFRAAMASIH